MSNSGSFEKKRALARELLVELNIKERYYDMLNFTIILENLKQDHSNNFFTHYNAVEKWLDKTNTEYYCKINYQSFLSHLNDLAVECEVIYFGIALLLNEESLPRYNSLKLDKPLPLKDLRFTFIRFFSVYNIPIDFRFHNKFSYKRKEILNDVSINDDNDN